MTRNLPMPIEQRRALVESKGVTLDGQPATVCGSRNDFATVRAIRTGIHFEWAWETVARIVARDGAFRS
jgi:hypothetical protein